MIPTDLNTTDYQKSLMDISTLFVTNSKPSVLVQPRQASFHNPSINSQTTAIFSSPLGQHRHNTFFPQLTAMIFTVIPSVSQQAIRSFYRVAHLTGNRRNRLHQGDQLRYIMSIRTGHENAQRDSLSICYQMMLRAFFAAIRWVGAGLRPPKTARTDAESTTALEKSIWSACRNLFNKRWCILSQTPASCQSRSRRQQVMPLPQPISLGKSSQPIPVLSTNRIPVSAARSGTALRPGYRKRLVRFGITGLMISHNSSSNIGFAMSSLHAYLFTLFYLLMLSDNYSNKLSFC